MRTIDSFEEMKSLVGEEIGVSEWIEITQDRIDTFAEATGDHQWIHVDVARAKQEMPGGKTIAHGYLTLSLVPRMIADIYQLAPVRHSLNYGSNRVRFTQPVPSGSRVRGRYRVKDVKDVKNGGLQVIGEVTVEIENSDRPACIAEAIAIHYQ